MPDTLSLLLVGDVNLRNVNDPRDLFSEMQKTFDDADVRFANCEGCYSDPTVELSYKNGWFHPASECVDGLSVAGFDAVGCANNVTFGEDAILEIAEAVKDRFPGVDLNPLNHVGVVSDDDVCTGVDRGVCNVVLVGDRFGASRDSPVKGHHEDVYAGPEGFYVGLCGSELLFIRPGDDVGWRSGHLEGPAWRTIGCVGLDRGHAGLTRFGGVTRRPEHRCEGQEAETGAVSFDNSGSSCFGTITSRAGVGNVFGWEKMAHRHPDGLLVLATIDSGAVSEVSLRPVCRDERGQPRLPASDSAEWRRVEDTVASLSSRWGTRFCSHEGALVVECQ